MLGQVLTRAPLGNPAVARWRPQRLTGASLLVLANKQDVPGALPVSAIRDVRTPCAGGSPRRPPRLTEGAATIHGGACGDVQALDLASIRSHRWEIRQCSARAGTGLLDGLDWLVEDVAQRIYVLG